MANYKIVLSLTMIVTDHASQQHAHREKIVCKGGIRKAKFARHNGFDDWKKRDILLMACFPAFMVWKILWHLKNGITRIAIDDDFSKNRFLHILVDALFYRY